MPPVVSNAGPLMVLAKLNVLPLLHQLYGEILFSSAVYVETVVQGQRYGYADANTLHLYLDEQGWQPTPIEVMPPDLVAVSLDLGERESIALALKMGALLLMDEERGREEARYRRIVVRGTLGVLIEAYRRNYLSADQLRFYFHQIETWPDIWISPALCRRLLQEVLGGRK